MLPTKGHQLAKTQLAKLKYTEHQVDNTTILSDLHQGHSQDFGEGGAFINKRVCKAPNF